MTCIKSILACVIVTGTLATAVHASETYKDADALYLIRLLQARNGSEARVYIYGRDSAGIQFCTVRDVRRVLYAWRTPEPGQPNVFKKYSITLDFYPDQVVKMVPQYVEAYQVHYFNPQNGLAYPYGVYRNPVDAARAMSILRNQGLRTGYNRVKQVEYVWPAEPPVRKTSYEDSPTGGDAPASPDRGGILGTGLTIGGN